MFGQVTISDSAFPAVVANTHQLIQPTLQQLMIIIIKVVI